MFAAILSTSKRIIRSLRKRQNTLAVGRTFSPEPGLNTIELDDHCNAMFAGSETCMTQTQRYWLCSPAASCKRPASSSVIPQFCANTRFPLLFHPCLIATQRYIYVPFSLWEAPPWKLAVEGHFPREKWGRSYIKREWGNNTKKVWTPFDEKVGKSSRLQRSYTASTDKQCHVLPEAIVQKCDATWCGNKTVVTSTTKRRGLYYAKPITHSGEFQNLVLKHLTVSVVKGFMILVYSYQLYLCSEGDSGCDPGGCWFDARLQRAQRALWVPFPTRTAGSVPQTSWWCPGQAGPSVPMTRSSWCRCHCCRSKRERNEMVAFTSRLQRNDKTNENSETPTVPSIPFHQLLCCLRVRYSFVLMVIFFQLKLYMIVLTPSNHYCSQSLSNLQTD